MSWELDKLPIGPGLVKRHGRLDVNMADPRRTDPSLTVPAAHAYTHGVTGADPVTVAITQVTGLVAALSDLETYADTAVAAAVTALIDGAPGALDTLNELAAALADDASFAATVTAALAGKASTGHSHTGLYPDPTGNAFSVLGVGGDAEVGWVYAPDLFAALYDTPDLYDTSDTYDG
jgi:hypothetical protein